MTASELHVYGFNFTGLDVKSRSLGVVVRDRRVVNEALRLFESDVLRQEFEPEIDGFVVSPENAREQLATFIKRSKKTLVIWDPKLSDPQMIRLLPHAAQTGVDFRLPGRARSGARGAAAREGPLRARAPAPAPGRNQALAGPPAPPPARAGRAGGGGGTRPQGEHAEGRSAPGLVGAGGDRTRRAQDRRGGRRRTRPGRRGGPAGPPPPPRHAVVVLPPPPRPPGQPRARPGPHVIHVAEVHQLDQVAVEVLAKKNEWPRGDRSGG